MSFNESNNNERNDVITNTSDQKERFSELDWFYNEDKNPDDFSEIEKEARGNDTI